MCKPPTRTVARGFTLIELMITVAVLGILAAIALPSFSGLIANSRVGSGGSSIWSGIQLARSEAIRFNRTAYLCPTTDGATCAANGSFATGWMVWVDRNNNGSLNAGEIVRIEGAMHPTVSVTGTRVIRYTSLGRPLTAAGAALGSVSIGLSTTTPAARTRFVCISDNGLPSVQNGACT